MGLLVFWNLHWYFETIVFFNWYFETIVFFNWYFEKALLVFWYPSLVLWICQLVFWYPSLVLWMRQLVFWLRQLVFWFIGILNIGILNVGILNPFHFVLYLGSTEAKLTNRREIRTGFIFPAVPSSPHLNLPPWRHSSSPQPCWPSQLPTPVTTARRSSKSLPWDSSPTTALPGSRSCPVLFEDDLPPK